MFKDENRHYSLRKLSVGLASVLIGISFASTTGNSVKADTVSAQNSVAETKNAMTSETNKVDANVDSSKEVAKSTNSVDSNKITPSQTVLNKQATSNDVLKGTDVKQEQVVEPKQETPVKQAPVNEHPTVSNKDANINLNSNLNNYNKQALETSLLKDTNKPETTNTFHVRKLNIQANVNALSESEVINLNNNGGFDSSWGKLNVNDWKGNIQGNYYQLTDYTGDANHVIVPNEADFEKAGISTSGKQVGVTSDLMHTIFKYKPTAQDATVAFSKTDNKQVKAIGTDWHNTFKCDDFSKAKLSKFDGTNLDVSNVTNMSSMFDGSQISDLSSLANWNVNNVTDMSGMFDGNQISDLSPLANWHVNNVTDMTNMFDYNQISDLSPLANWKIDNVTDMSGMFDSNQISDLSPLANWHVNNVTYMSAMFQQNDISNLSPLANWKIDNVTDMSYMFYGNQISDLSPLANWHVNNVTGMTNMFVNNQISDLSPLANWHVNNVTNMMGMFYGNQISDLSPLASWNVNNVTDMRGMFYNNQISDLSPLANWKVDNVTDMSSMFDDNISSIPTNTVQAKRIINFVYPAGYTGKKQDLVTQTVDVPTKQVKVELTTKETKPSNNILDWVTKTETPETPAPVYFQDYTVPEIKGLLEPDKTVISRQQADITKPINATVTYKLVDSNTNDAYALDSKHGLHEHANVNDNGGYDADFWGKINVDDWNYTVNNNTITIIGYKGEHPASLIIPNGADFGFINDQNNDNTRVEISSSVMHDLAKNATRIGLSKTANKKVIASNAIWQDAFGGLTNEPGTDSNADGGIKYGSPNLTQMDLHNLDTAAITDMSALFNGGSNLATVGDLSDWDTSNVTNMRVMFQKASSLTNIGNLDNWDTSKVTDMVNMFSYATNLTNIGDLSKWDTSKVTDMALMFANVTSLTNIGNLDNWDTSKVTDMHYMFGTDSDKQSHLTNIGDLSKWQTDNVTDMSLMFTNATSLTNIGNLDNWDTSKVTDMHYMFANATNLTNIGDLSKWQTDNVTNMSAMFANATNLTNIGDLFKWQTGNVTDMSLMFTNATNLTNIGDLSKWQIGNVTDMSYMFTNATNLTNIGNLDNWDTSKVTNMSWTFGTDYGKQSHLTNIGSLSRWQTGNVTNMSSMFAGAASLTNIGDLNNWDTSKVTDMSSMFNGTEALRRLNISNWNLTKLANKDAMKYMFANDINSTVIANDLKLPTWYQNEVNDADYFWNNHIAVITNVPELIKATGDIDNLKIDDQDASRSIFYDSKGSSYAVQVLKDANQAYINKYEQDHPKYLLALDASVDQTDPIALANAVFKTSHKIIDVVQTNNSTRTIIVHLPNGTTQTIVQTIGLKRNAQKDLVTEIISSTAPWELDEANSSFTINGAKQAQTAYKQNSNIITFSSIKLPKVPGYKAKVARNNGLLLVSYLALAPKKPKIDTALNELQFSNKLATNSAVNSNLIVKSDMYQVANDDHNWQLPVIKSYDLKFATNKNQIIFAYTKDKQYNYRFVLTFKDGQYRLATFNKQGKLLKTYSIKSYEKLAKIIDSLVLMNIA